jgi:hypothetical protein
MQRLEANSVDYAVQEAVVKWLQAKQQEQLDHYNAVNGTYQEEVTIRNKQKEDEKFYKSQDELL